MFNIRSQMQSDGKYQLPVSNIPYHIYNSEENTLNSKSISQVAFKRTMDSYQEYEHLADLFQAELAKRGQDPQERKTFKTPKKSSKKIHSSRNQEQTQSQPERQSLRLFRNSSASTSNTSINEQGNNKSTTFDNISIEEKSGSLKRSRQNSDISTSDISGNGDDEAKFNQTPSKISSIRHRGLYSQANERSLSNSPILPLTPSPQLTPSDSGNNNSMIAQSKMNQSKETLLAQTNFESPNSQSVNHGLVSATFPSNTTIRRNKRKQAIPVHPSVVDRIPGITLRIQREALGDQLQVEILKNLDDYTMRQENQSPSLKLQAIQDLRKVKDSIESGRPGYAFFPSSLLNSSGSLPDMAEPFNSVNAFSLQEDSYDIRSLPLSWENFSTRECVMNKVIGKHDKDLDILEEVVQDVILRNHYNEEDGNENDSFEASNSQRRRSRISTSPSTAVASATMSIKSSGASTSPITRSAPSRTTRSRKHISDQYGYALGGDNELIAHEDIESVLKQKRRRKSQERRERRDSKGGSRKKDNDEDDDDEEEGEDNNDDSGGKDDEVTGMSRKKDGSSSFSDIDGMQYMYSDKKHDLGGINSYTDRKQDSNDDDITDGTNNRTQSKDQQKGYSNDTKGKLKLQPEATIVLTARTRGGPVQSRRQSDVYVYEGLTESSDSVSESEDDDDYKDKSYKSAYTPRRKSIPVDHSTADHPADHLGSLHEAESAEALERKRNSELKKANKYSTKVNTSNTERDSGLLDESQNPAAEHQRRNKKSWTRGRNTRKEDLVATTDDEDENSSFEDTDGDKVMTLAKHVAREGTRTQGSGSHISSHSKKSSISSLSHVSTSPSNDRKAVEGDRDHNSNSNRSRASGGRTRARARSFSSTIDTDDKTKFFENALGAISQKRREALAKKRAAREAEEKERQEKELKEQRDKELRDEIERRETAALQRQKEIAQKAESSNQPKSSKSLPGRVLRRIRADPSSTGEVDPDCTSCRLELSADDKTLWKIAQESKEITLPKTWGTHAILCTACRLLYMDHHWRCTACFYVPVRDELSTSSCSRCRAGTWLREDAKLPSGTSVDRRQRAISDISV